MCPIKFPKLDVISEETGLWLGETEGRKNAFEKAPYLPHWKISNLGPLGSNLIRPRKVVCYHPCRLKNKESPLSSIKTLQNIFAKPKLNFHPFLRLWHNKHDTSEPDLMKETHLTAGRASMTVRLDLFSALFHLCFPPTSHPSAPSTV